ncbi:TIGR03773 family transporter-associated surface protein [Catenuloplanes japonicus]|uniref:TIGR03773 family transporter-associated surface protein n=1 Tax=Catenuloplanes japonicus TaxID=33876 RepID=UPI0005256CCD|nr:TIGR03773 family transporter-associated surface protein [Catenuloplanes japonicus]
MKILSAAVALALVLTPGAAPAAPADGADLITVSEDGGGLSLRFRDAAGAVHDPAAITLGPGGGLSATVPDDAGYAFLGPPGRAVWSLSAGGPHFPSLDATGVRDGSAISLRLDSVDGPGGFAAYTVSRWGAPTVLLDSDGPRSTTLPRGERVRNVAWTFDAGGVYRLGFTAGQGDRTASAVYTVEVPVIAPPASGVPGGEGPAGGTPPHGSPAGTPPPGEAPADEAPAGEAPVGGEPQGTVPPGTGAADRDPAGEAERSISLPAAPDVKAQARVAPSATGAGRVISDGHVDLGPQLEGGAWRIRLKDDAASPPAWLELSDVVLKVTDRARIPVPAGDGYAFLGAAGSQVHLLPQTQQSGIVWPGWNTQHASVTAGIRGDVTWSLTGVDGPGAFALFLTSSFGTPQVLFDSRTLPQKLSIPLNTHAHGNWAFTEPGLYRLTVTMSATTTSGAPVTDTRTLTFAVGDATDPAPGFTPGGGPSGGSPGGSGPLPLTGTNLLSVVAAGLVLIVAGFAAVVIGRRRTVTQHTLPPT